MDFVLSQKQLRLREQFRRLAESLEPAGREYPRANLQRLAREGCLGLPVPREWAAGEKTLCRTFCCWKRFPGSAPPRA